MDWSDVVFNLALVAVVGYGIYVVVNMPVEPFQDTTKFQVMTWPDGSKTQTRYNLDGSGNIMEHGDYVYTYMKPDGKFQQDSHTITLSNPTEAMNSDFKRVVIDDVTTVYYNDEGHVITLEEYGSSPQDILKLPQSGGGFTGNGGNSESNVIEPEPDYNYDENGTTVEPQNPNYPPAPYPEPPPPFPTPPPQPIRYCSHCTSTSKKFLGFDVYVPCDANNPTYRVQICDDTYTTPVGASASDGTNDDRRGALQNNFYLPTSR